MKRAATAALWVLIIGITLLTMSPLLYILCVVVASIVK